MNPDSAERLTRIESHLAHLEHQFEQLNQVIVEQGREITRLKTGQQKIAETIESAESERIRETNTKPPHYGTSH